MEVTKLKIRPYARLLTMLGEQLIKNEQIALAELIKNSYDADADWVRVEFNHVLDADSGIPTIVVEDNGSGMNFETIQKSWMNPATPNKHSSGDQVKKTVGGRIVQGEKGIGRFAILKLGKKISIITRPKKSETEYVIDYDFSAYDNDFLTENGKSKELFLDDISVSVIERVPEVFTKLRDSDQINRITQTENGTRITISNLKGTWTNEKIKQVNQETQKLESLFGKLINRKNSAKPFEIIFLIDSKELTYSNSTLDKLDQLINQSSVLKITEGTYNEREQQFRFNINGEDEIVSLHDPKIMGLNIFRNHFVLKSEQESNLIRRSECGDFRFTFYVFDLSADRDSKYYLDKEEKELVKEHRVYLYRDGIRVAPYGDPDNDWLGTDKRRATGRTGDYLSNDQVVGFVDISKENNPNLRDKTNREGLIEEGNATEDFIILLHTFLLYIRQNPYQRYQQELIRRKNQDEIKTKFVQREFEALGQKLKDIPQAQEAYKRVYRLYLKERKVGQRKLEITEDLAGVGLSVETASHDLMLMLLNGLDALDVLIQQCRDAEIDKKDLFTELNSIRGMFSFVKDQMKNLQLLFRSSRQRKHPVKVFEILQKVVKIYSHTLLREKINLDIEKIGSPVLVQSTDAVFLQVFINLFDNAIYWIQTVNAVEKTIRITLDGDKQQIIFSDSGPGIDESDVPYIFDAFYSAKSMGRGLGLYIARQLLSRVDCSINLITNESDKLLSGANFVIRTSEGTDDE